MPVASLSDLDKVFATVVSVVLVLAGIATFFMLITGGIRFILAGSDKEATQKAWKNITFAVAGLLVSLSAWVIINFLSNFLNINFSTFTICLPTFTSGVTIGSGCNPTP